LIRSNFLEDYVDIRAKLNQDKENARKKCMKAEYARKSSFVAFSSGMSEEATPPVEYSAEQLTL